MAFLADTDSEVTVFVTTRENNPKAELANNPV